jgi:hypothetical protein
LGEFWADLKGGVGFWVKNRGGGVKMYGLGKIGKGKRVKNGAKAGKK